MSGDEFRGKKRGSWDPFKAIVCSPERYLLLALLDRVYRDLQGSNKAQRAAAERWVKNDAGSPRFKFPLEFGFVCDALGLDREKTRALFLGE